MQMAFSAGKGAMQLMDLNKRKDFIDSIDKGTINEEVISQATGGPIVMLSLFNDLQNPLFKQHNFDVSEFLSGVRPALERFHSVSGLLEQQFEKTISEAMNSSTAVNRGSTVDASSTDESIAYIEKDVMQEVVMQHRWKDAAEKDPESLAGQLSRMMTTELLDLHQESALIAFSSFHANRIIKFNEGSFTVNNAALISARAFLCAEKAPTEDIEGWGERSESKYELIDYNLDESELKKRKGGVAAQLEVLYDVSHEFVETIPAPGKKDEPNGKGREFKVDTSFVAVAVLEGWLSGGPDDQLRWKISLYRPAFEFPHLQEGI